MKPTKEYNRSQKFKKLKNHRNIPVHRNDGRNGR